MKEIQQTLVVGHMQKKKKKYIKSLWKLKEKHKNLSNQYGNTTTNEIKKFFFFFILVF